MRACLPACLPACLRACRESGREREEVAPMASVAVMAQDSAHVRPGLALDRQVKVTAEKLWEVADMSRVHAGRRDKQAWLSMFSKSAIIQDPVGKWN